MFSAQASQSSPHLMQMQAHHVTQPGKAPFRPFFSTQLVPPYSTPYIVQANQSASDTRVVRGATLVVQEVVLLLYCCGRLCPNGGVSQKHKNMRQIRVVHACRRAVFVALLLFARDGIQRVVAPPAPVGRPAGKQNRAGAGKPGPPSQADKRRKIMETKRHDSRWKRWSGAGEQSRVTPPGATAVLGNVVPRPEGIVEVAAAEVATAVASATATAAAAAAAAAAGAAAAPRFRPHLHPAAAIA